MAQSQVMGMMASCVDDVVDAYDSYDPAALTEPEAWTLLADCTQRWGVPEPFKCYYDRCVAYTDGWHAVQVTWRAAWAEYLRGRSVLTP